jgi:hypothetical protein
VTATAQNTGDEFTVKRLSTGTIERKCKSTKKECPGKVTETSTW